MQDKTNIVHVTKHPYTRATRTLMQARWIKGSIILTTGPSRNKNEFINKKLTALNLFQLIKKDEKTFIFHEQGTLNYLLFTVLISHLLRKRNIKIAYDIHDIYGYPESVTNKLTKPLDSIKSILESFVFSDKSIKLLTVSKGLSKFLMQKYGRQPEIVPSISQTTITKPNQQRKKLVYFGTLNIFPYSALPFLSRNLQIDYYDVQNSLSNTNPNFVNYMGPYTNHDLSFLSEYMALIVSLNETNDHIHSYNLKHSLPNKFFQSLSKCLPIIIHGEFNEAKEFFKEIEGFIYSWSGDQGELIKIIKRIEERNFGGSQNDIYTICQFLKRVEKEAKDNFSRLITNSNSINKFT